MEIRLQVFETVSILMVQGVMSNVDARALLAGIGKIRAAQLPVCVVDIESAIPYEGSIEVLSSGTTSSKHIVWAGDVPSLCRYADIESALKGLKVKERLKIVEKLELESQIESASKLFRAKKMAAQNVSSDKSNLTQLEGNMIEQNRNLRASQTHIINRLLDPVFSEIREEALASESFLEDLESLTGLTLIQATHLIERNRPRNTDQFYNKKNLKAEIDDLEKNLKGIQESTRSLEVESSSDRLVSLYMEHETLTQRLEEVRIAWCEILQYDSVLMATDVDGGMSQFLSSLQKKQEAV